MNSNVDYFNELNDDVINEIFQFLDAESMKVATEVCKKWNVFISERKALLSKLKFVFPENWKESEAQIRKMTRKMSTIEFRISVDDHMIQEILEEIDLPIEMLVLNGVIVNVNIFRKLLEIFQCLDKLIMNESSLAVESDAVDAVDNTSLMISYADSPTIDHDISADHPVKVMSLIAISEPDEMIMEELIKMQLQSRKFALKTDCIFGGAYNLRPKLEIFLKMQKILSELIIKTAIDDPTFNFFTAQLSSTKLKKLVVISGKNSQDSHDEYDALAKFIKSQTMLEEFEIRSSTISENVVKAFYETKKLNKLILDVEHFPIIGAPIPCVPHLNLKTLIADFCYIECESLEALMKMFANIENLGFKERIPMKYISSDIIHLAHIYLKSIKFLFVPCIFDNGDETTIPSLKKLHVVRVSPIKLRHFVSQNVSLQEVKVDDIHAVYFDFEYTLQNLVNLTSLSIEYAPSDQNDGKIVIDEQDFRFFKQNSPHFRELEIGGRFSVADSIDHSSIKVIKFDNFLSKKRIDTFDEVFKSFDDDEDLKGICWKNNEEDTEEDDEDVDFYNDYYNEAYRAFRYDSDDVERDEDEYPLEH